MKEMKFKILKMNNIQDSEQNLENLLKSHRISQRTYDKVTIMKRYIERKYNLKTIKNTEFNEIINKINDLKISDKEKEKLKKEVYEKKILKTRKTQQKQTIYNYKSLEIIGRGAFGEVHVCKEIKITPSAMRREVGNSSARRAGRGA